MKAFVSTILLFTLATPAMSAPPPELRAALAEWATPRTFTRFQFAEFDLNRDGDPDMIVHVTDPDFCANGGCPLVAFRKTATGYALVGSSGLVRKPIYVLEESQSGWFTLAALVGLGEGATIRPIRYREEVEVQGYRSRPFLNAGVELTSAMTRQALNFVEAH